MWSEKYRENFRVQLISVNYLSISWRSTMDMESGGTRWRDGKYKSLDGDQDLITIRGDKFNVDSFPGANLKYGSFGEADPKIVEKTGEKNYNVELSFDFIGKAMASMESELVCGSRMRKQS